jgi:diguanylate cyclase (GGDEF)-like protein
MMSALRSANESNSSVAEEFIHINLKRALQTSICCVFLDAFAIIMLLCLPNQNMTWQTTQIWINIVMMIFILVFHFSIKAALKQEKPSFFAKLVPYIGFVALMAFSFASTANDQQISGSITTYVMICLICGALFLIRPFHSILLYTASFAALIIVNSYITSEAAIRTSNSINAFSMTVLSVLLSVILWHNNRTNVLQAYQIRTQQKLLEKTNVDLHKLAYYDPLTDLPNRRYLNDILQKETALIQRKSHESCLIMLDLDYFKFVNDKHGHPVGDKLLVEISSLLMQNIRIYDTLCRLGGEEFMILLPQTTLEEAVAVAHKLLNVISSEPFVIDDKSVSITTSIGVSRLTKDADATLIEQYTHVDMALYKAKRDGRNCVRTA